ncbi:hypothetical protein [Leptospira bouyouniensis]|nr:hypothetical protein [Leptospira bouyouniensis]
MNAGIDLAVSLGMTIASGAVLLYGSGGTPGTLTANSSETVVLESTRRE